MILSVTLRSLRTSLAPVSDWITRGCNAIFGHVARLPDNILAHQAMLRQVELSVGRPQTLHENVHQVDHVPNGPTNSAAITTMFPLRLCGAKLLVAVTRKRRYGPSRLRVNDDDDSRHLLVTPVNDRQLNTTSYCTYYNHYFFSCILLTFLQMIKRIKIRKRLILAILQLPAYALPSLSLLLALYQKLSPNPQNQNRGFYL